MLHLGEPLGRDPGYSDDIQKLTEVEGEAHLTWFKDIVPKPYQEFRDVLAKESFDELQDWKKWDHTIELVPDAQTFSTKVYPLDLV